MIKILWSWVHIFLMIWRVFLNFFFKLFELFNEIFMAEENVNCMRYFKLIAMYFFIMMKSIIHKFHFWIYDKKKIVLKKSAYTGTFPYFHTHTKTQKHRHTHTYKHIHTPSYINILYSSFRGQISLEILLFPPNRINLMYASRIYRRWGQKCMQSARGKRKGDSHAIAITQCS